MTADANAGYAAMSAAANQQATLTADQKVKAARLRTERAVFRQAAFRAPQVYPGPVGELIAKELISWEDMGYLLGKSLPSMLRVAQQVIDLWQKKTTDAIEKLGPPAIAENVQ